MKWDKVCVEAISYRLPEEIVTSDSIEARLSPLYSSLGIGSGQIEALTGIRSRRMWPPGPTMSACATGAAREALSAAGIEGRDLGAVIYAGVCRDNLEPATACAVADAIGAGPDAFIFDISNACLGVLNGMVELANRIELGQIRAGLVVSAESSRDIVDTTIARLNASPSLPAFRTGLATLTGGSGAVAVVLTARGFSGSERRLVGGAVKAAPAHHRICRWGPERGLLGETANIMETHATEVLEHGIDLAKATWRSLQSETGWRADEIDRVICHQVGEAHRREVLRALEVDVARDFSTFTELGNIGTVSLPMTAAMAHEQGFLATGDRVGFLGIGSGLNCVMLAVQW